jgi:hypothetical protein
VKRLRGGLVRQAHSLLYHATLGSRVIKKKKKKICTSDGEAHNLLASPTGYDPVVPEWHHDDADET